MARVESIIVPALAVGLDYRVEPSTLPDNAVAHTENIDVYTHDVLGKRRGTAVWPGGALTGVPMLIDAYYKSDGSQFLIAITTQKVYRWNDATSQWVDISPPGGLTGTPDDIVTADIINDVFVFTNGVDPIMHWDGVAPTVSPLPNTPHRAKIVRKFSERLFALHLTNDGQGNTVPSGIKFTAPGTYSDWTGPGSGTVLLSEGVDFIVASETLGPVLVIYKERSIVTCQYTGGVSLFRFDTVAKGIGIPATRSVVDLGNEHLFLAWDTIYSYAGGRRLEPIGDPIQPELLSLQNVEKIGRSMSVVMEDKNQAWFAVPTFSDYPDTIWIYDYIKNRWLKKLYTATCGGYWNETTGKTFGSAVGTFGDAYGRFGDRAYRSSAPIVLFGRPDGTIEIHRNDAPDDAGRPILAKLITKEYHAGDFTAIKRWVGAEFELMGGAVEVWYRVDRGPWYKAADLTLVSEWKRYRVDFDVSGRLLQLMLQNGLQGAEGPFHVRGLEVKYIRSGAVTR